MNKSELEVSSISLSTLFRNDGSLSNPLFILPKPIDKIRGFKVKSAMVPMSFYTFDTHNNKIYFTESDSGSTVRTATIPVGNYSSSTLPFAIKTAMDLVSGSKTYTVTFDSLINKITATISSVTYKYMSGINNAYYELGIISSDINSYSATVIPSQTIDLSGPKIIHLVSNIKGILAVGKQFNILASIITEEANNTISSFVDDSQDYISTNIDSLSDISISLYDDLFRPMRVNKDFTITVNFLTE